MMKWLFNYLMRKQSFHDVCLEYFLNIIGQSRKFDPKGMPYLISVETVDDVEIRISETVGLLGGKDKAFEVQILNKYTRPNTLFLTIPAAKKISQILTNGILAEERRISGVLVDSHGKED